MLSASQKKASARLDEFIGTEGDRMFIIQGGAGSGKTYMVASYLNSLPAEYSIIVVTPTHKAMSVIKQKINTTKPIQYKTLASLLGLEKDYSIDGRSSFKRCKKLQKKCSDNMIIFIDECSMISETYYNYLLEFLDDCPNTKIIFIGDGCQLPPVNENGSVVFSTESSLKKFTLEGNIRVQESQPYKISKMFRDYVLGKKFDIFSIKHIFRMKLFLEEIYSNFKPGEDRVLSYSRKKTSEYNQLIRNHLFDNPSNKFVDGEQLEFTDYYIDHEEKTFYTGFPFQVNGCFVQLETHPGWGVPFKIYKMYSRGLLIRSITEDDEKKYRNYCLAEKKKLKKYLIQKKVSRKDSANLWKKYYNNANLFLPPINYSYAKNIYQSQGSTYRKVFIDVNNIYLCTKHNIKLFKKAIYTAASRASHETLLYCPNNIF